MVGILVMGKHGKRAKRGKVAASKSKVKAAVRASKGLQKKPSVARQMISPKKVSVSENPLQRMNEILSIPDTTDEEPIDTSEEYVDPQDLEDAIVEVEDEQDEEPEEDFDFF